MEEHIYYNNLFDCYGELLTLNEKECFKSYYSEDLSLKEIAENNSVSRSAVHKTVKTVIEKLENYESILHLYEIKKDLQDCLILNNLEEKNKRITEILEK